VIYLIGSLRNQECPKIAHILRTNGHEVFDDWYAAGPEADDYWQKYEKERGHSFQEALDGYAAKHVYEFDLHHLNRADTGVLVLPAGKSGHLEFGYLSGLGKRCYILLDKEPERFDVMYRFATKVVSSVDELLVTLKESDESYNNPNHGSQSILSTQKQVGQAIARIRGIENPTGLSESCDAEIEYRSNGAILGRRRISSASEWRKD